MSKNFTWEDAGKKSILTRIESKFHHTPSPPLKERINNALHRLKIQLGRLEQTVDRLQSRDKELFDRCVKAMMMKDEPRAAMYANEIAEIRKMARIIIRSQLALEQVTVRLETIEELGDMLVQMGPVAGVVKAINMQLAGVIPEVASELESINDVLNGIVLEAGDVPGRPYNIKISDEEAKSILNEANAVAEQRMKDRFPELPAGLSLTGIWVTQKSSI
ncbi:MAG: Snf7 family protein [Candidatus Bathyarchaeia archaeon]